MEKLNLSLGLTCCFIGLAICLYAIREFILNDFTWPFILIVGLGIASIGFCISGLHIYRMRSERKQKKDSFLKHQ